MGPPPAPGCRGAHSARRTSSAHSRFLHRLPPLATGVGDVGAAAVHGAQPAAAPPQERARTARFPTRTTAAAGTGFRGRARSTCVLPRRCRRRRAPRILATAAPRVQVRRSGLALRGEGRIPGSEAAQVPSTPAEAA